MKPGDKLRFRGPAGAEFVVTVGPAFTPKTIEKFVASGEWTPVEAPKPRRRRKSGTGEASAKDVEE